MSNIGATEAFCGVCGVVFRAKNEIRVREEGVEHTELTGHEIEIRPYYHRS